MKTDPFQVCVAPALWVCGTQGVEYESRVVQVEQGNSPFSTQSLPPCHSPPSHYPLFPLVVYATSAQPSVQPALSTPALGPCTAAQSYRRRGWAHIFLASQLAFDRLLPLLGSEDLPLQRHTNTQWRLQNYSDDITPMFPHTFLRACAMLCASWITGLVKSLVVVSTS